MQTRISILALGTAFAVTAALAQNGPVRPKITGISHLAVYTSDAAATEHFYTVTVGAAKLPDPENPQGVRYAISATQFIEVLPLPAGQGVSRLDHAAFNTESADRMRKYLAAKGWKTPAHVRRGSDGSRWFEVLDPEGNKIQFVEPAAQPKPVDAPNAIGHHIIHVGFLVHDRAAEDAFYRDLLGFRPYWWGGRDNKVEWVSQQVPDGHDWLEYMLRSGTGQGSSRRRCRRIPLALWIMFRLAKVRFRTRTRCLRRGTGSADGTTRRRRSASTVSTSSTFTTRTESGSS